MDSSWHVVLRDIMVMLAAASVVVAGTFSVLVLWQLWRLAKEVQADSQPILDSVRQTAEAVQGTAEFVGRRTVPPAATAAGLGAGAVRVVQELTRFYRGLRPAEGPSRRLEG